MPPAAADEGVREVVLEPKPRLRPLTWAGASACCALLVDVEAELVELADDVAVPRPLTVLGLLRTPPDRVAIVDAEGLVRAACADEDGERLVSMFPDALGAVASSVLGAFRSAVAEANERAALYGWRRRLTMPAAYRRAIERRVGDEESGDEESGDEGPDGPDTEPVARTVEVDFAERGPEWWSVLDAWPLAKTMMYLEDLALAALVSQAEHAGQSRRGGGHG